MTEEPNKYFEGKPCKLGHTLRYVRNKCCVECHKESGRKSRKNPKNRERVSRGSIYLPTDFQHRVFVLGNPNRTL
ncbi:hypothetical protein Xekk_03683 [Xenorhabdus sp. KK7.4]|nr:hypothetical protein Xekk_03683 [Xenorhabdus sp. KK7.4]